MSNGAHLAPLRERLSDLDDRQAINHLADVVDRCYSRIGEVSTQVTALDQRLDELDKRNLNRTIAILAAVVTTGILLVVDLVTRGVGGG
jgi:Ni,Fe-hydrogenase III large subunit